MVALGLLQSCSHPARLCQRRTLLLLCYWSRISCGCIQYVSKSPPPVLGPRTHSNVDSWHSPSNSVSDYDPRERHGADPEMTMATSHHQSHPSISSMTHNNHRLDSSNSGTMGGPSYEELSSRFAGTAPMTDTHDTRHPPETEKDLSRSAFPPASVPAEHDQNSHLQNGDPIPVLPTPSPPAVAIPAFFPPQAPASPQPTPSPLKKNPPLRRNSSVRKLSLSCPTSRISYPLDSSAVLRIPRISLLPESSFALRPRRLCCCPSIGIAREMNSLSHTERIIVALVERYAPLSSFACVRY